MAYVFEHLKEIHWQQVKTIYEEGIKTGNATFESSSPEWEFWKSSHDLNVSLVVLNELQLDIIIGWSSVSPVSSRCVYEGVGEISVYIHPSFRGKGIGNELLKKTIEQSERNGYWTIQAGIFPENKSSIAIHTDNGFKEVGIRERIGKLNGVWRNVMLLERRSEKVGL